MSDLKIANYKTFIDHLQRGVITDVVVYNFSSEIEITYTHEGTSYGTSSPYGAGEDNLLHKTFDNQGIKYTILKEEYGGGESSYMNAELLAPLLFFGIPIILLIVIIVQAGAIKKLASKLPDAGNGT